MIDSLAEGFSQVNRILWVILFPIGLDLLFWLAPRLSPAPLVNAWLDLYAQAVAQTGRPALGPASPFGDEQSLAALRELGGHANLLTLLAPSIAGVPALAPSQRPPFGQVLEVGGLPAFLGLFVGLQIVGLGLGCAYLGLISQQVRDGQPNPTRLGAKVWRNWLAVLAFVGILVGIGLGVSIPASVLLAVLMLVAPPVAAIVYAALSMSAFFVLAWMLLYLFFLVDAVVVGELGPLAAVRSSVQVVRSHLGPSLGLILLTLVISLGMGQVWHALAQQPWGLAVAVIGNAYVASGLSAASMLFYLHRAGLRQRDLRRSRA